jgi:hypothetical protein
MDASQAASAAAAKATTQRRTEPPAPAAAQIARPANAMVRTEKSPPSARRCDTRRCYSSSKASSRSPSSSP